LTAETPKTSDWNYHPMKGIPPKPGSFLIAECDAGIANRLRVLAFFMEYTQSFRAELFFVWEVNVACLHKR